MSIHVQLQLPSHYRVFTSVEGYIGNTHYRLRLMRTDALGQMIIHGLSVSWGHWQKIDGEQFLNVAKQILHISDKQSLCAVPDCGQPAMTKRSISINNAPKQVLPVCFQHADAADEDQPISDRSTSQPVGQSAAQKTK